MVKDKFLYFFPNLLYGFYPKNISILFLLSNQTVFNHVNHSKLFYIPTERKTPMV